MLFFILGFVLFYTIIYIALPVAVVFAIIAFIQYLRMKKYEVFRNIAIILFIPVFIAAIIYLTLL